MKPKYDTMFEDRETVINYCQYHIGEWAEVYTTDKVIMRRYEKFCKEHPDYAKVIKEDKYSMTFSVHPKAVGLYPRAPKKSNMTEERKKELAEQMNSVRAKRKART